jgi:phage terminase large subunit-like protein
MFDENRAFRVKKFIERLKHSKGIYAGKPFILEDWQYNDIIRPLYGTLNADG